MKDTRYWILDIRYWILGIFLSLMVFTSCTSSEPRETAPPAVKETPTIELTSPAQESLMPTENTTTAASSPIPTTIPATEDVPPLSEQAEIMEVKVSGEVSAYNFSVTISSPDEGCSQYADWWEVITEDGELLYRRVLLHSHVNEQPFTRSGGPVPVEAETIVLVRAHMNTSGYGSLAMKGSPVGGFEQIELAPDFALELDEEQPLPQGCDF